MVLWATHSLPRILQRRLLEEFASLFYHFLPPQRRGALGACIGLHAGSRTGGTEPEVPLGLPRFHCVRRVSYF